MDILKIISFVYLNDNCFLEIDESKSVCKSFTYLIWSIMYILLVVNIFQLYI